MEDQKTTLNVKKYLKKLIKIIKDNASFKFMGKHIVSKSEINDIICCIEGCMPEIFDDRKHVGSPVAKMRSIKALNELSILVKNKALLSSSSYSVDVVNAEKLAMIVVAYIDKDFKALMDKKYMEMS